MENLNHHTFNNMDLFANILKNSAPKWLNPVQDFMSWFQPQPTQPQAPRTSSYIAPQAPAPTLFWDEKTAYEKMMQDWIPEQEAISVIKERRDMLWGGIKLNDIEARALKQMASEWLWVQESLQALKEFRTNKQSEQKAKYDALPWYDKAGLQLVGAWMGAMTTVWSSTENLLWWWAKKLWQWVNAIWMPELWWALRAWWESLQQNASQLEQANQQNFWQWTNFESGNTAGKILWGWAMMVAAPWPTGLLGKWAWIVPKVIAWASEGALQAWAMDIAMNKEANLKNMAIWAWVGGALPIVGAGLSKAKKIISESIPKKMVASGLMTPSALKNASERLSRLSNDGIVNIEDAPQWMLDKWLQWSKKTIQSQLSNITDNALQQKATLFAQDASNTYKWVKAVDELQQAMIEVLPNYAQITKTGIIPKAGNADKVNAILEFVTNPAPTAKEIDTARTVLWDMGIFAKSWEMTDNATKEWLQKVWVNASKFLDETLPWFRALNKDIEVAQAMKKAMGLKEAQDFARQHITFMNAISAWAWAWYGYTKEWDITWAAKYAAAWLGAKYLFNNPAVTTFVAQKLKNFGWWKIIGGLTSKPAQKLIRGSIIKKQNDRKN